MSANVFRVRGTLSGFPARRRARLEGSVLLRDLYERTKAIADNLNVIAFNLNRAGETDFPLVKAAARRDASLTETWRVLDATALLSERLLAYHTSADDPGGKAVKVSVKEVDREPALPKRAPRVPKRDMLDPRQARQWGPNELASLPRKDLVIVCGGLKINPFTLRDRSKSGLIQAILDAQGGQATP